jgi:hypothetical protein
MFNNRGFLTVRKLFKKKYINTDLPERTVDRDLIKVCSETMAMGVGIGKEPSLI